MRTTMDLDATLINKLVKASGSKSKTEAIETAAREYLKLQARRSLAAGFGTIDIAPAYLESRAAEKAKAGRIRARAKHA